MEHRGGARGQLADWDNQEVLKFRGGSFHQFRFNVGNPHLDSMLVIPAFPSRQVLDLYVALFVEFPVAILIVEEGSSCSSLLLFLLIY